MKRYRVFGNTNIVVTTIIEVPDDKELTEEEIYAKAHDTFKGVASFAVNGGEDKLIGVCGENDTIDANNKVESDDYELLED